MFNPFFTWVHPFVEELTSRGYSFLPSLCWSMVLLGIFMVMGALMLGNMRLAGKAKAE